jgi:hypothetical protein
MPLSFVVSRETESSAAALARSTPYSGETAATID